MVKVKFKYIDKYSHGEWKYQEGYYESEQQCIDWNGLEEDPDCYEYEILSVEKVDED